MKTKKLLVAFDPSKPRIGSGDFLVPVWENDTPFFLGTKSKKLYQFGRVVFIGKEINENDLFARLVETGKRIQSVEKTLKDISDYLAAIPVHRIGDILQIDRQNDRLILVKTDLKPATGQAPLP
ncbi:MAG: hypothetical protein AAB676_02180 [Verrucomicrobiota bacterium]